MSQPSSFIAKGLFSIRTPLIRAQASATHTTDSAASAARVTALLTLAATALCALPGPASAQQDVPFANGVPVAPELKVPPLPSSPRRYDTAEGMDISVSVVARGLANPYSIAFLPDGDMLVTEKDGRLRIIRDDRLLPTPATGVPAVSANRRSGLNDLALHPDFETNRWLYFSYHKPLADGETAIALGRGRWNGTGLDGTEDVFVTQSGVGDRARIAFGPDGTIYLSTNGAGNGDQAQDLSSHGGKILRLTDDGNVPADNPLIGIEGAMPEIFTIGHRTTLGLAMHPVTGEMWQNENGPNGGDEINVLKPGANYGWPLVSLGRTYQGPWHSPKFQQTGFEDPIVYWTPSIAVSGMAFYTGTRLPKWQGDVFVGSLRTGEIIGTGHIERVLFNENMEELRREALLRDMRHRMRDVRMGPDELLYVLVDDTVDGAVLRIAPAE